MLGTGGLENRFRTFRQTIQNQQSLLSANGLERILTSPDFLRFHRISTACSGRLVTIQPHTGNRAECHLPTELNAASIREYFCQFAAEIYPPSCDFTLLSVRRLDRREDDQQV